MGSRYSREIWVQNQTFQCEQKVNCHIHSLSNKTYAMILVVTLKKTKKWTKAHQNKKIVTK